MGTKITNNYFNVPETDGVIRGVQEAVIDLESLDFSKIESLPLMFEEPCYPDISLAGDINLKSYSSYLAYLRKEIK